MPEPTTGRILFENENVKVFCARQGLVVIDTDGPHPFRWEDVLDITPTLRGGVVWGDEL